MFNKTFLNVRLKHCFYLLVIRNYTTNLVKNTKAIATEKYILYKSNLLNYLFHKIEKRNNFFLTKLRLLTAAFTVVFSFGRNSNTLI